MAKDYYMILGLASSAEPEEIRAAYRRRALKVHPDHSGGASDLFVDLQEAYGVLSKPELRRAYDQQRDRHHVRRRSVAEPLRASRRHVESLQDRKRGGTAEPPYLLGRVREARDELRETGGWLVDSSEVARQQGKGSQLSSRSRPRLRRDRHSGAAHFFRACASSVVSR
jgi:curved DNA-binding protein CbpA